ncbi:MAG: hypothetical protein LBD93_12230 [Treponema sp.]|jgi:hypothetical protein|nr:hypothetical protein [Treponema sp.]
MNPLTILQLDLCAPLIYCKDEALSPFAHTNLAEDTLFCFDITPEQHLSIEPEEAQYLGELRFAGTLAPHPETLTEPPIIELPQGTYMFAQVLKLLDRAGCIWMAMEVQKEGLWRRFTLERQFYLRYLVEEERTLTQVFRPYRA